jgi:hypothetical protein
MPILRPTKPEALRVMSVAYLSKAAEGPDAVKPEN